MYKAIILTLALASAQLGAVDYTWTGNAGNGEWTDAGNWTGTGVPGTLDNATIGGGVTVTVSERLVILNLGGLVLNGTLDIRVAVVTISGPVEVSGTIKSKGITEFGDDITLTGDSTLELQGETAIVTFDGSISGAHSLTIINTSRIMRLGNIRTNSLLLDLNNTVVSQSAGNSIRDANGGNTCRLQMEGSGTCILTNSGNRVGTIAVNTTGNFNYVGSGILAIGELDLDNTGSVTGINTGGTLSLVQSGDVIFNADIRAGTLTNFVCQTATFDNNTNFTVESGQFTFLNPMRLRGRTQMVASGGPIFLEEVNSVETNESSLTVRAGGSTDSTLEAIGATRSIGDLTLEVTSINANGDISLDGNLTINSGTLSVPRNNTSIDVGGSLTGVGGIEVAGSANINIGKDFTIANFTAGDSTLTLDENTTASIGAESGYILQNLTIDKHTDSSTNYGRVTAVSEMQISGNLAINRGTLNCGTETMSVVGNMTVRAPGRFEGDTVKFIQSASTLEANGSIFNNLEVVDSNLNIQNSDFTATGRVRIVSETNPAQLKFIRGSHSARIANLLLEGANAPLVDFTNWNFNISSSLNNEDGKIILTGEQNTQAFPYVANKKNMGLVSYYNGNGAGTIRHGDFWNLEISASGQIINLASDIRTHGYDNPNSDKTLDTPVSEASLTGLRLSNGTLNTANHKISLHGSYIRASAATISGELRLTLLGSYPAYIGGNNSFSEFICEDASVRGKILYFQSGRNTNVVADGRFLIRGSGDYPPGRPIPSSLVFPSPRSYVYVVSSQPSDATHYWNFNRTSSAGLELAFVYLLHSDASSNPQVRPVNVTFQDCPNWHIPPYIELSWTKDIGDLAAGAAHNGRIDKILVESDSNLSMDFSDLRVEVEGYRVRGFQEHGVNANQFYILLEEQDYLDTSATPRWKFVQNRSLKDVTNGFELRLYDGGEDASQAKAYETPYDDAAPIIGYTLAIADKDEIFVHFSEPVVDLNSESVAVGDFSTTAGGGLLSLRRVSDETNSGMQELILRSSSKISALDILNGVNIEVEASAGLRDMPSSQSTHDFDSGDATDSASGLVKTTHRVSDVGLGLVGNGLVEPISARGSITPVSGSGAGVVTSFAWDDFLPADNFSIMVHRYEGILRDPNLIYSNSATAEVKNGRLWLPVFGENAALDRNFSGLVPRPHTQTTSKRHTSSKNDNYTYQFRVPDAMIKSGRTLEFVFHFAGPNLYCAQVLDDTASNWYRKVVPWAIRIQDVAAQAGNVSILNNILNPNNNDKTSMYYELSTDGFVTIQVFDLSGDTVAVLQRGFQSAGQYTVYWDGRNGAGNPVARGIYFVRIVGPGKMDQIRKVLVIK